MAFRDLLHTLDNTAAGNAQPEQCIITHLNWLLNTRRDRHPQLEGFGMPDLHEYLTEADPETVVALELRKVIERYEPRLSRVRVLPEPGPEGSFYGRLHARFVIEGVLAADEAQTRIRQLAEIDRAGYVDLS
jgi:type VI secretion system lysozyme-like protein